MVERSRRKTKLENDETGSQQWLRIFESVPDILTHTVAMVLSIGSIWLIHWVLELLLGKNARFFDLIPIRYVIDAGDLVVILKFLWEVIKGFSGGTKK
jgi:hypothetical protein